MKRKELLACCLLLLFTSCIQKREYKDSDLQVCIVNDETCEDRSLYGFKDRWGEVVIEPQFVDVEDFSEGLALVRDRSLLWGFVDYYGKMVVTPQFVKAESFSDGFAPVADSSGKWGYIDQKGKYLLKPQFERAYRFMSGCAVVNKGAHDPKHIKCNIGGLFGMIDRTGKVILPIEYTYIGDAFSSGLVEVSKGLHYYMQDATVYFVGQCGFVNTKGEIAIPLEYDVVSPFSNGVAFVRKSDRWGIIDSLGNAVTPLKYDSIYKDCYHGFHLLEQGKWIEYNK